MSTTTTDNKKINKQIEKWRKSGNIQKAIETCKGAISQDEEESIKLYNNHSCDPNCGMHGEISFVAIRDIEVGEELTIDYAFIDNEDYSFECHCGSPNCRHTVTGFDWTKRNLQEKYYPYFAQYLKDKIDYMRAEQK